MDITEKKYLDGLSSEGINSKDYTIIVWPESQYCIGDDQCTLINDEEGLDLFGSSAYIVPIDWEPNRPTTIKEQAINWAEGLYTDVTLTDDVKDEIISEMENIPSTGDHRLRDAVKSVLVEMAIEGKLDGDINDLDIDTVFEKVEDILQGRNSK